MDGILVSINCITYNHEAYIADAIESFLMQKTNFKFEILIHDDASTDNTANIIRKYEKKYPKIIKSILQKENQLSKGISPIDYIYNHKRAAGKYVAMCEGDDYWTDPYKLQKQVDYMENHNQCSMCFHAATMVTASKGKIGEIKPYDKDCIVPTEDIILGDGGFMATNSILYRKNIMDNAPDFYLHSPIEDYPLQIFTSIKDYAYYIDEFMSVYRLGVEGSWTSNMLSGEGKKERYIKLKNEIIYMLNGFNEYSSGRYSDAVNKTILENEIKILITEKKAKQIKMPKYRSIYDSLVMKEKMKIYINSYFPNTYHKLTDIKRFLKEKLYYNIKIT